MNAPPIELRLEGQQGKTVIASGDVIKIEKKTFMSAKREKTIQIRNIASVEVKKPGAITAGFIQFSIAGGKARDSSFSFTGGAFDAASDENSMLFVGEPAYEQALKIKGYVETWSGKDAVRSAQPPMPPPAATISAADEIRKLKALVDEGLITAEQFEHKKKELLGL